MHPLESNRSLGLASSFGLGDAAERSQVFFVTHLRALIWKLSFLRFFQTGFLRTTSEAFPLGGRWPGAAGTDEGATGYPTEQKKTGIQAAGRWTRAFYKERLGTESPPHQSASQTASPQGEAAGRDRATALIPFVRNASQPAQPGGGPLRASDTSL